MAIVLNRINSIRELINKELNASIREKLYEELTRLQIIKMRLEELENEH